MTVAAIVAWVARLLRGSDVVNCWSCRYNERGYFAGAHESLCQKGCRQIIYSEAARSVTCEKWRA